MSRIGKFRSVLIMGRRLRIGNEERLLKDFFFFPNDENILNSDCGDDCTCCKYTKAADLF